MSVESNAVADRVHQLRCVRALGRFVSAEPLLEELDCRPHAVNPYWPGGSGLTTIALLAGIDVVFCGGESGPGARRCEAWWVQGLRDSCKESDVPFYFKGWGMYAEDGRRWSKPDREGWLDGRQWREIPLHMLDNHRTVEIGAF